MSQMPRNCAKFSQHRIAGLSRGHVKPPTFADAPSALHIGCSAPNSCFAANRSPVAHTLSAYSHPPGNTGFNDTPPQLIGENRPHRSERPQEPSSRRYQLQPSSMRTSLIAQQLSNAGIQRVPAADSSIISSVESYV